jgi:hypothetical protein
VTLLTADFEAGTNGATIATGDTGSASVWQTINTVAGGTLAYDTTHPAHGTKSAKIATGSTAGNSMLKWTTALTGSTISTGWVRAYLYMTSFSVQIVPVAFMNGTFTNRVGLRVNTSGKIVVLDG